MNVPPFLHRHPEVAAALQAGRPVVALESTLIAHGLPWPSNLETARQEEAAVRQHGGIPATIAILDGTPTIGLEDAELERLAKSETVLKAARRDLAAAVARKHTAATTVSATMHLAHLAGIQVMATGGIGGAHRHDPADISADLPELARTPVVVVCAGAKSILDIPRTLEILETLGVPVIGYGTDEFPAFYARSSGQRVSARVDSPEEAADLIAAHWQLGGAGVVLAQAVEANLAFDPADLQTLVESADRQAAEQGIRGPALTPFLLARLAEATQGRMVQINQALVVNNAALAAKVAVAVQRRR